MNAEPVVISAETPSIKEKIVKRKTIVYQASIDPTVIRVSGEKLKLDLFASFGAGEPWYLVHDLCKPETGLVCSPPG